MGDKEYSRRDFLRSITAVSLGTVGVGLTGIPKLFAEEMPHKATRQTGRFIRTAENVRIPQYSSFRSRLAIHENGRSRGRDVFVR